MPSSNRSSSIPTSFGRFRVPSIQFLTPFRNHSEKHKKKSPDRLWTRKIKVHPDNISSSESERMNRNTTNLFPGNERLNKSSSNLLITRRTSNTVGICPFCKLPITSACHPSQLEVPEGEGPHTLCMIRHRNTSLPTITPTRGIKHPKSLNNSVEKLNFDRIG